MYSWIDVYVTGLLDLLETRNIYDIYDAMNISIYRLPPDSPLLKSNEAIYNRSYFNKEVVFIKNILHPKYEKFVLAHELGHAVLHTDIKITAFNRSLVNRGKLEKQANYFALKLLNIDLFSDNYEGLTIDQISALLHVPKSCLLSIL